MSMKYQGNCWNPSDNAVGYDVTIGTFSSTASGYGKKLTSIKTKIVDVLADDGGANFG